MQGNKKVMYKDFATIYPDWKIDSSSSENNT